MAKGLHQVIRAALSSDRFSLTYMVRLDYASATLAWHGGNGDVSHDGAVFVGAGALTSVSGLNESPGVRPSTMTVTLSGVNNELLRDIMAEPYMGRTGKIYLALLDEAFRVDPEYVALIFSGSLDAPSGTYGRTASISVPIKSRLADWERVRSLKYTDADQQLLYTGDKYFEFVPQMSQKKLIWPRAKYQPDPRD